MKENIEVLEEVLDVLEEEKRKFYNLVNQNEFRIEEINSYLRELTKREDEDFKVFSPRNVHNIHREQIEADTSEMKKYKEENAEYNKKIEGLKSLIDKVNIVIGNLQIFEEKEIQPEEDSIENTECIDLDVKHEIEDKMEESIESEIESECEEISDESIDKNEEKYSSENPEVKQKFYLESNHIAHQILNCVSFITPDPERAKIELTALSKKIME